ncbi:MAG: hypothetical protein GC157_18530 [Frankiales bacterium]|nr:hypothetical protein [Frankiales bacterium]
MIRETCSCGATLESDAEIVLETFHEWRRDHRHAEPAAGTVLKSSGPTLADVVDRLTAISEHLALIERLARGATRDAS